MAVKPKELRYAVDLGESGILRTEDGTPLETHGAWTPEHLLLAALIRCSLKSLDYHGRRAGIEVRDARGSSRGLVTRRESDGRYAMVEGELDLAVELVPAPGPEELAALLGKAERDCFVAASLQVKPAYRWTVNGLAV